VSTSDEQSEVETLRARVAELENQLAEQTRVTNALVARSQDKLYWLERWHIDLDKVMRRRSAQLALEALKPIRAAFRGARKLKRRATGQG
jgi:hypothetical protein